MKPSAYTHVIDLPDGTHVLANLLWQTFVELDATEHADWLDLKRNQAQPRREFAHRLSAQKMVVGDDVDELEFMHGVFNARRHSGDVLGLTIAPTIDCNLACIYCYENKKKGGLTEAVAEQIRSYVRRMLPGRKHLSIIWYGGEPLLCKQQLYALSKFFRDFARECGCGYSAEMTTNAVLFDSETVRELTEIGGWRNIQITLDGVETDHDARRPARGGQGTFQRVYDNLIKVAQSLPVSLRMNVDAGNVEGCRSLLRRLAGDIDPARLHVYPAPTHFFGKGCRDIAESGELDVFDNARFATTNLEFVTLARELGFRTNNELNKKTVAQCQAVSTNSVIIEPDGGLQRCWTEVGDDSKRVGHVAANIDMTQENVLRWLRFDPTASEPCRTCDVLPTCFGGCPQRHLDGRPSEMICAGIRFRTKATLRNDYIAAHRPDLAIVAGANSRACGSCGSKTGAQSLRL